MGSGKGASLCGSSARGAPFWGSGRIWGGGHTGQTLPHGGGVHSLGTLTDRCKVALEMGHLSQWDLC